MLYLVIPNVVKNLIDHLLKKGTTNMISTKGRYALRVLIDLAENEDGRYIPLKDVAERQEISSVCF